MSSSSRANPIPETQAEALIRELLTDREDEAALSAALGVDLTPPGLGPGLAAARYGPLDVWLLRSEEVHRWLEARHREERRRRSR